MVYQLSLLSDLDFIIHLSCNILTRSARRKRNEIIALSLFSILNDNSFHDTRLSVFFHSRLLFYFLFVFCFYILIIFFFFMNTQVTIIWSYRTVLSRSLSSMDCVYLSIQYTIDARQGAELLLFK